MRARRSNNLKAAKRVLHPQSAPRATKANEHGRTEVVQIEIRPLEIDPIEMNPIESGPRVAQSRQRMLLQ
jgi:hypothetical protein